MGIVWTEEALGDLEEILAYYYLEVGPATAEAVQQRILSQIEGLESFPEWVRTSERIAGAREFVVNRLPYIAFVKPVPDGLVVLNVVHTARKFPK